MTQAEAKKRINKLIKQIDELRYAYHVLNDPAVSDEIYDSLQQELTELEKQFPALKRTDSPLSRIGGQALDTFTKVSHQVQQWSFNDVFNGEELAEWMARIEKIILKETGQRPKLEYVCELKIDGLHIVFTYRQGVLELAATRGDGKVGENVTENIKTIHSVPLKLKQPVDSIVEGEVWMSVKQLEAINAQRRKAGLPEYANPRNFAAGTIRQLDPKAVAERKLDCFVYDWSGGTSERPDTQIKRLKKLRQLGFQVNQDYKLCRTIEEIVAFWQHWQQPKEGKHLQRSKNNSQRRDEVMQQVGHESRYCQRYAASGPKESVKRKIQ